MIDTDALKAQVEILDVLDWLGLDTPRATGYRHKIRCPLPNHSERTPSCVIYEQSRTWFCFGCQNGGDVIDLVQGVKGLSFLAAAEWVADHAGASIERSEGRQRPAMALVEPVAAQAHLDVVEWVRRQGVSMAMAEAVFLDYDETMRAYDAHEIDAKETIHRLIVWRLKWKDRLDI